jgi:WD40 repeat protein/predicted Ser/Thr protein kinase
MIQTVSGTTTQHATELRLPQRFGNYELLEEVGRGGTGIIYRARQIGLERICAVKMLHPGGGGVGDEGALFEEARAAASLDHPNIVRIFEMGIAEGREFFSMEFVEGENLADWARTRLVPVAEVTRLVRDIAEAVAFAHGRGVCHLDLKPANILMDRQGRPHLTDFGMARLAKAVQERDAGQGAGTPNYLAPEQACTRYGSPRAVTDVFGIGGILYFLLTDRAPFRGETLEDTLRAVLEEDPVHPTRLRAGVPDDLETICLKCLEKRPSRRYRTVSEVASDLQRELNDEPIQGRPVGLVTRVFKWWRRHPLAGGLGSLMGMLALAAVASTTSLAVRMRNERNDAMEAGLATDMQRLATERRMIEVRKHQYVSDLALVFHAREMGADAQARETLRRHRPGPGEEDLRGWEWRFLEGQVRSDEVRLLGGMEGEVQRLELSPDGNRLWATDNLGGLMELDPQTGKLHRSELIRELASGSMVMDPGGRWLAVGDRVAGATNSLVKFVDATTWLNQRVWAVPGSVLPRAVTRDGGTLWLSGWDRAVVLSVESGEFREYRFGTNGVRPVLAVSPDAAWAVVGRADGELAWLPAGGTREGWVHRVVEGPETRSAVEVTALAFSPDGRWLVSGLKDGRLNLVDVATRRLEAVWSGHSQAVHSVRFNRDGSRVLSVGDDSFGMIRQVPTGREVGWIRGLTGVTHDAVWVGEEVVTGGTDGTVRRWRMSKERRWGILTNLPVQTLGTALVTGGGHALVTTSEGMRLWELPGGRELLDLPTDPEALASAVTVGSGGQVKAARYWVGGSVGVRSMTGDGPTDTVTQTNWVTVPRFSNAADLTFSPDGKRLAVADTSNGVRVYRTEPMRLEHRFGVGSARLLRFSADGRRLAAATMGHRVLIWDLDAAVPVARTNEVARLEVMDFAGDGQHLLVGDTAGVIRMLNPASGREEERLSGGAGGLTRLAKTPDGRRVVAGTVDGRSVFRDVETGREMGGFRVGRTAVTGLEFRADESLVVAMGEGIFILGP